MPFLFNGLVLDSKTYSEWEHPFYNIRCPHVKRQSARFHTKMENIVQKISKPQTALLVTNVIKNIVSKESLFDYIL